MARKIRLKTSYNEWRNQFYYTTFHIVDELPKIGDEVFEELPKIEDYSPNYGETVTDIREAVIDCKEHSEELQYYDFYIVEKIDSDGEKFEEAIAIKKPPVISIYLVESATANDFILISYEDDFEETIKWYYPELAPSGYWIDVDVCGSDSIEEKINALKAQHEKTDYDYIASSIRNGEIREISDYRDMLIDEIEDYEAGNVESFNRDEYNFISEKKVQR